jgi:hypothetical protein
VRLQHGRLQPSHILCHVTSACGATIPLRRFRLVSPHSLQVLKSHPKVAGSSYMSHLRRAIAQGNRFGLIYANASAMLIASTENVHGVRIACGSGTLVCFITFCVFPTNAGAIIRTWPQSDQRTVISASKPRLYSSAAFTSSLSTSLPRSKQEPRLKIALVQSASAPHVYYSTALASSFATSWPFL